MTGFGVRIFQEELYIAAAGREIKSGQTGTIELVSLSYEEIHEGLHLLNRCDDFTYLFFEWERPKGSVFMESLSKSDSQVKAFGTFLKLTNRTFIEFFIFFPNITNPLVPLFPEYLLMLVP
jgi:hypothetical protein